MAVSAIQSINPDVSAMRLAVFFSSSVFQLERSMMRLATGLRILFPDDDPAGLAQSIRLDSQAIRVGAVQQNITNVKSFTQTQTGLLGEVKTALDRMSVLSVLAQDATATETEAYQTEFAELQEFITEVAAKQLIHPVLLDQVIIVGRLNDNTREIPA